MKIDNTPSHPLDTINKQYFDSNIQQIFGGGKLLINEIKLVNIAPKGEYTDGNMITKTDYAYLEPLTPKLVIGHKYYFSGQNIITSNSSTGGNASTTTLRITSGLVNKTSLDFTSVDSAGNAIFGEMDKIVHKSMIYTSDGTEDTISIRYGGHPFQTLGTYYNKINLIDLTSAFGEGNEPTLEFMEKLFLKIGYITGEKTITYGEFI